MLDLAVTPGGQLSWNRRNVSVKPMAQGAVHRLAGSWELQALPRKVLPPGTFQGCSFSGAPMALLAAGIQLQSAREAPQRKSQECFCSVLFQLFEYLALPSSPKFWVTMKIQKPKILNSRKILEVF